ncbi:unnamed protein product [Periconia digitata]|uniref:Uncharacterized protein n=1 Tax=Periconia digitata TaxID=1303443 RepID=A0A9W4UDC1_9PLEO|nr:unnamed protein product [Periconia digitata]
MSDRSAPKEHPKNQPRNPSSLRNQLHDSEIQVPDSQIVIQETQQGGEVMTPASGGDPLSPNSQKLLHRTTQPVVQEQYDMSNEGPVFGLVRPTMVDDPRFIFPPHNSSSKTAAKQENTQGPNSSSRPCIEPPTNNLPTIQSLPHGKTSYTTDETNLHPTEAQSEEAVVQEHKIPRFDLNMTAEQAVATIDTRLMLHVPREARHPSETALSEKPQLQHSKPPGGRPKKKVKKLRLREKAPQSQMANHLTHDNEENRSKSLNLERHISVLNQVNGPTESYVEKPQENLKQAISFQQMPQELPNCYDGSEPMEEYQTESNSQIDPAKEIPACCKPHNGCEEVGGNHAIVDTRESMIVQGQQNDIYGGTQVQHFVDSNHNQPPKPNGKDRSMARQNDVYRVSKRHQPARTNHSPTLDLLSELPPKYVKLFGVLAQLFKEEESGSDQKAVEANSKAYETAVAALKETQKSQAITITTLETSNKKLRESSIALPSRMQKFIQGMEAEFDTMKRHAKLHRESCDRALQEKFDEFEIQKKDLIADFEKTLSTMNESRRRMRAVLDDCFSRLKSAESKKTDLSQKLAYQTSLFFEEQERRRKLEEDLLTTLHTMQANADIGLESLSARLDSVQMSSAVASSHQIKHEQLQNSVDALRGLLNIPFLTTDHIKEAEKSFRSIGEQITTDICNVVGSVQGSELVIKELQNHISNPLQTLLGDMTKCLQTAKKYRDSQEVHNHLIGELEGRKKQCEYLENQIHEYQQMQSDLKAQNLQLQQQVGDLERAKRSQSAEFSVVKGGLEDTVKGLNQKILELELIKEQLHKEAGSLMEVKKLRDAQDAKVLELSRTLEENKTENVPDHASVLREMEIQQAKVMKEKDDIIQEQLSRLSHERDAKGKALVEIEHALETTRGALRAAEEKSREIAVAMQSRVEEHQAAIAGREVKFSADMSHVKQQLKQANENLILRVEENAILTEEKAKLQDLFTSQQEQLTQSREQLSKKQSLIDDLRKREMSHNQNYDKVSNSVQEHQKVLNSCEVKKAEAERVPEQASSRERQSIDNLETQLSAARHECEEKDTQVQELQNQGKDKIKDLKESYEAELQEMQEQLRAAEVEIETLKASVKRLEDENRKQLEAHEQMLRGKFEQEMEKKVYERTVEGERETQQSKHTGKLPVDSSFRHYVGSSITYSDHVPGTQVWNAETQDTHFFVPETQEDAFKNTDDARNARFAFSQVDRNTTSPLTEVPSDATEEGLIDMTEPKVSNSRESLRQERSPGPLQDHLQAESQSYMFQDINQANMSTRMRPPSTSKAHTRKSSWASQQSQSSQSRLSSGSRRSELSAHTTLYQGRGIEKKPTVPPPNTGKLSSKLHEAQQHGNFQKRKRETGRKGKDGFEHDQADVTKRACLRSSSAHLKGNGLSSATPSSRGVSSSRTSKGVIPNISAARSKANILI